MKVALATWFPRDPTAPRGGVETVSVNLVAALARRGDMDLHVITFDCGIREKTSSRWAGAVVHRLPQPPGPMLAFAAGAGRDALGRFLASLQPDVVHAHDTFGIMTRDLPFPRVFTIHGFIHEDTRHHPGALARVRALAWKREELRTWAEQPHIISISPYVRERLRGIARGMIHDIDNPVDAAFFSLPRKETGAAIFSAAVLCPRKNQQALVRAAALLDGAGEVRLAGPVGEERYGIALRESAGMSGSGRAVLLGNLTMEGIRRELTGASVFALVSLEEGAPMGLAEAMAAGVPVVASNRCGMPYMVRHGETGFLVDPLDLRDIARHLGELLDRPDLRAAMGEAARHHALDRYHPDRVAERTARVYHRAVDDAGTARAAYRPRAARAACF